MKNLVAQFGSTRLSKIKRSGVRDYRNARLKSVKGATVNREMALLRHMFNVAMSDGIVGANPARGGPGLEAFKEEERERFLEMPEVETLLAAVKARIAKASAKKSWQYLHTAIVVALHTGMRKTEILSLKWNQISWEKRNILLTHTKNGRSRRVPIDSMLLQELAEHRSRIRGAGGELVFPSYDRVGNVVPLQDVKVGFGMALRDAGISDFRFHDLRHTFASHYMMSGGNLYTLSKILGHKDLKMTQRYAELSPAYIDRERERMDTIWTPKPLAREVEAQPVQSNYVQ